jgi:hypothetical protein
MSKSLNAKDFNKVELISIITQCEIEKEKGFLLKNDDLKKIKNDSKNSELMKLSRKDLELIVMKTKKHSLGWYAYFKEI